MGADVSFLYIWPISNQSPLGTKMLAEPMLTIQSD